MKKLLSIVLVLTMILSVNAFALSSVEYTVSGTKYAAVGSGMEAVLAKSGSKLTVTVYLVGELNKLTGVTAGLKAPKANLTVDSVTIASEFTSEKSDWGATQKNVTMGANNMCGYVTNAKTLTDYLNVAAGSKLKFMEVVYTIVDGTDITADNYSDYLSFLVQSPAKTVLTFDSDKPIYPNDATYSSLFEINASGLDSYNLSINTPANGVAELGSTTVAGGQSTTLTVIPAVGYYIDSVMAGATNITSSFDAYRGGSIQYTPTASAAITVTFAEIENVTADVTTATGMTGTDAHTLPEVFRGTADGAEGDVSVAFGQINPNAGRTIKGYGIYLTKSDGSNVTTANPNIGPKFAANSKSSDNQFGIIFEQIKAGSYFAQTYVEYEDGIVFGIKVPFTVAE